MNNQTATNPTTNGAIQNYYFGPAGTYFADYNGKYPDGSPAYGNPHFNSGNALANFFEGQKQMKMLMNGGMPGMPNGGAMMGARKAGKKVAKNAKGKRRSGDPRKAGLPPVPGQEVLPAAAAQEAPQSMEELAELLRDAQAAGGPGNLDSLTQGFPGLGGGPGSVPPAFGGRGSGTVPAAFGKRDKKKK